MANGLSIQHSWSCRGFTQWGPPTGPLHVLCAPYLLCRTFWVPQVMLPCAAPRAVTGVSQLSPMMVSPRCCPPQPGCRRFIPCPTALAAHSTAPWGYQAPALPPKRSICQPPISRVCHLHRTMGASPLVSCLPLPTLGFRTGLSGEHP